ncbi:hypothetical protein D3C76_1627490 [compost metagenome]|jgi:hypothetical protein|uniref:hypothetical protein n=1 Tax=Pseudomonas putida TaxID=303 RepID=UPI000F938144|nr:hypothetical protein [Pseudomonas putida]
MFGNVLTYDAYHLALYLITAMAWVSLGFCFLLRGVDVQALYKGCAMFGVALTISVVMLVVDIMRMLEHHQVEMALVIVGMVLPVMVVLTFKASSLLSKPSLKRM